MPYSSTSTLFLMGSGTQLNSLGFLRQQWKVCVPSTFLGGARVPEPTGKEGQGGVMMGMIGITYCDYDKEGLHHDYGEDHVPWGSAGWWQPEVLWARAGLSAATQMWSGDLILADDTCWSLETLSSVWPLEGECEGIYISEGGARLGDNLLWHS